jgi:hypothetical protein
MHDSPYETCFDAIDIEKRIKEAMIRGISTCVLTGTGEVLQNITFLDKLYEIFEKLDHPFPNMEIQTTGVMLSNTVTYIDGKTGLEKADYPFIKLLKKLRINTVSLSISNLFDDEDNANIIGISEKLRFKLPELISVLKKFRFNIRLSLNMLNNLDDKTPEEIFKYAKSIGADQISFKKMYYNEESQYKQNDWIRENICKEKILNDIKEYVLNFGRHIYTLEFGAKVYSINGLSAVVVDDCMAVNNTDIQRYIILRENGKLYCHWDDEGSLIF